MRRAIPHLGGPQLHRAAASARDRHLSGTDEMFFVLHLLRMAPRGALLTSSASSTATCAAAPRARATSPSSPADPHARRSSTPRPDLRGDRSPAAAGPGRAGRAGHQPLPARLGGLLPPRDLGPPLPPGEDPRDRPARALRRQTAPAGGLLRLARGRPTARPIAYGLINLSGSVVAPRPNRPWREKPNVGGQDVGEPGAREPHTRFDEAAGRTQRPMARAPPGVAGASRRPYHDRGGWIFLVAGSDRSAG
jgi:hypothetical protein